METKVKNIITEDEWINILTYLYEEHDAVTINLILKKTAQELLQAEQKSLQESVTSPVTQFIRSQLNVSANTSSLRTEEIDDDQVTSFAPSSNVILKTIAHREEVLKNSQGVAHPAPDLKDKSRLGYASPSLKKPFPSPATQPVSINSKKKKSRWSIERKDPPMKLPFDVFMKTLLDFQV